MSTLREARGRTITFGSVGRKKIRAVSEANCPVNFVESEQIDSSLAKIHQSIYEPFLESKDIFLEIWLDKMRKQLRSGKIFFKKGGGRDCVLYLTNNTIFLTSIIYMYRQLKKIFKE